MTDHQLARSTAEKIALAYIIPPDKAQDWEDIRTNLTQFILASYRERDRAATTMGGETAALLDRQETDAMEIGTLMTENEELRSALTTLQESNREVVFGLSVAQQHLNRAREYEKDRHKFFTAALEAVGMKGEVGSLAGLERQIVEKIKDLRARLALADETIRSIEKNLTIMAPDGDALALCRRWTAPQAGTTPALEPTPSIDPTQRLTADPQSPAIPITPETPPVFPCWLWSINGWARFVAIHPSNIKACGFTHYHPDQPTAPTCRPTATEGGV